MKYDAKVTFEPKFGINRWAFIYEPPLTAGEPTADSKAVSSYNKLMQRTMGPYNVIEVRPNTIIIDENGAHNTVSTPRVSHAGHDAPEDGGQTTNTSG